MAGHYKYPLSGSVGLSLDWQRSSKTHIASHKIGTMRFSIILALVAGGLVVAKSLPQPESNNLIERKEATCRMKDPDDASGDPWRTGRCKASKKACGDTGGEAFQYVFCLL